MMRLPIIILFLTISATLACAQTTHPAPANTKATSAALELGATTYFNKGDFKTALPLLQKLSTQLQADPKQKDKLAMVQEQIRVCQKNQSMQLQSAQLQSATVGGTVGGGAAVSSLGDSSTLASATPPVPPELVMGPDRRPHPAPKPGEIMEMSIKELGNFEFDAETGNTPIPPDVQNLSGSTIRLHGFMIPMDQAESISQFALVPSLFACCYGQPPQIQHTIVVNCPKGKAVSYYPDEIVVQGKLTVQEKKDDGFIVSLFEVEANSVKPAAK
jgi:hypothetical protein